MSFSEAVLGVSKEIETVTVKLKLKLMQERSQVRFYDLKGKGLPSIERYGTGDLMVHINVWTPQALDKKQRKFFESMLG